MPAQERSVVVRLDEIAASGLVGDGVHERFASGGRDLDVNLVHLEPGSQVAEHVNHEVDVVLIVVAGSGRLHLDDEHELAAGSLAYVTRGSRRSLIAGADGLTYVSAHRARGPLQVHRRDERHGDSPDETLRR